MTVVLDGFDKLGGVINEMIEGIIPQSFVTWFQADVVPWLAAVHSEYFSSSSGPSGPWAPWFFRSFSAPGEHNTLIVSGALQYSMQPGATDNVLSVTEHELQFGTSVEYAGIHNFGGTITTGVPLISRDGKIYVPQGTRVEIPQREFVGLDEDDTNKLVESAADFIIKNFDGETA